MENLKDLKPQVLYPFLKNLAPKKIIFNQ